MRILHISTRLILGGSQENTVLSCEGQARLGHQVHLAFGPIYGPEGSLLERVEKFRVEGSGGAGVPPAFSVATGSAGAIHTHIIPSLVRQISPFADYRALRELEELMTRLRPDIVHTHSSKAGILGRIAAWNATNSARKQAGASSLVLAPAIIHTIHGPPFMPVEGSPMARLKTLALNAVYTLAERYAARRCHTIVSVADAMTRQFLARNIGRPEQYVTVRSGMETGPFLDPTPGQDRPRMRRRLGLAETDIVVGTVARLAQHKGHDDLLDAIADQLRARDNLKLLWVGDGWWRERLTNRARELGLTVASLDAQFESDRDPAMTTDQRAHIILTGLVPPARVPGLIRAMDVLAHPSFREGLPRTVPQALLAGVCPVAYDCDGTGEICRDMQTGRLVPTGNVGALRDALLWAIDHPTERAALAAAGRAECARAFDAATMVEHLEHVYQKALVQPANG